jgi:hypothetical protein
VFGNEHYALVEGFLLLLGEISPPVLELVGVLDFPHSAAV